MKCYVVLFALATAIAVASACQGPNPNGIDASLILRKMPNGRCPAGANNFGDQCCCYDGCCWDNCRVQIPPEGKCLKGLDSATWDYDGKKKFWVLVKGPKQHLVPKVPASGCPKGTWKYEQEGRHTCCCEHGCCWDKCVQTDPSNNGDCLKRIDAKWVRNSAKGVWTAQIQN